MSKAITTCLNQCRNSPLVSHLQGRVEFDHCRIRDSREGVQRYDTYNALIALLQPCNFGLEGTELVSCLHLAMQLCSKQCSKFSSQYLLSQVSLRSATMHPSSITRSSQEQLLPISANRKILGPAHLYKKRQTRYK